MPKLDLSEVPAKTGSAPTGSLAGTGYLMTSAVCKSRAGTRIISNREDIT